MEEVVGLKNRALSLLEEVLFSFGAEAGSQFLQDTPIRASVWHAIAGNPDGRHELLLTPNFHMPIAQALSKLGRAFERHRAGETSGEWSRGARHDMVSLTGSIQVRATAEELLRVILPETVWWRRRIGPDLDKWRQSCDEILGLGSETEVRSAFQRAPAKALWRLVAVWAVIELANERAAGHGDGEFRRWTAIEDGCRLLLSIASPDSSVPVPEDIDHHALQMDLFERVKKLSDKFEDIRSDHIEASVWSVDLDRPIELAVYKSRRTVKVDAVERVFGGGGRDIRWAVIDAGIDATHPAFLERDSSKPTLERTRVIATYDFTRLSNIFRGEYERLLPDAVVAKLKKDLVKPNARKDPGRVGDAVLMALYQRNSRRMPDRLSRLDLREAVRDDDFLEEVREYIEDVKRRLKSGEVIDWPLLEPLLRVPHDDELYQVPGHWHGTHVAGILAGDLRRGELRPSDDPPNPEQDHVGMCPEMRLYDLRVCDESGTGSEFLVLAALQFIDYLNREHDRMEVHGANMSLSLRHRVRDYACGQTPVCKEANRLVGSGVVLVAAAGNHGFQRLRGETTFVDAYGLASITDPGNAEEVITVGATYRDEPHTYGVSYFSSRGPTGDGRQKPDLLAPGERISAPAPGPDIRNEHGTSMAAPHVSGAAALIMARNGELVGNPRRIKQILCDTATDLNRRREFQGAGVVDVLRALQSI